MWTTKLHATIGAIVTDHLVSIVQHIETVTAQCTKSSRALHVREKTGMRVVWRPTWLIAGNGANRINHVVFIAHHIRAAAGVGKR
jgi:hypothetical protein